MESEQAKQALWYSLITIIFLLIWKLVKLVWIRPKKVEKWLRQQGLNGNAYKPIIGDVRELIKSAKSSLSTSIDFSDDYFPRLLGYLYQTIQKHGKNCFLWIGPTPWLIVTEGEKIREIITKHEDFQKPNHPFTQLLMLGLFGLEGDQWAKHRRIINPAFHLEKLKNMADVMYESCNTMMSLWEEKIKSGGGSAELDVMPYFENLAGDVISRAAFGTCYEQGKQIYELITEHVTFLIGFQFSNYIPGWRYVPTSANRRVKQICKEVEELLTKMINMRRTELGYGGSTKNDLLSIMLESNMREERENGDEKQIGLTTAEVVQECKLFYLAGSETTSCLLAWTLILLSKYDTWQERAREEVLQIFGKDGKPNFEGLNRAKVVNMIILEVLRLYPPAYMLMRKVYKGMQLWEWLMPAGTEILLPICILQQECSIWGNDAKEFNPERFSEGVSNATKGQAGFFPFSTGPRTCIGQNFSLLEAKLALTIILQRFSFKLSPNYIHAPSAIFTLKPQYGAKLILRRLGI